MRLRGCSPHRRFLHRHLPGAHPVRARSSVMPSSAANIAARLSTSSRISILTIEAADILGSSMFTAHSKGPQ
jgi:hypothetical protein